MDASPSSALQRIRPPTPLPAPAPAAVAVASLPASTADLVASGSTFRMCIYVLLWYFLTVVNSVSTKKLLNDLPLPAMVSAWNLILGVPMIAPTLLFRRSKIMEQIKLNARSFGILGAVHALGHLCTIYSLSAGSVSFTHIIKSGEPIFAALFSGLILNKVYPLRVYATLIPIIVGVSLASADASMASAVSFTSAMLSNVCYQLRSVLAKSLMLAPAADVAVSPSTVFRILTVCSALLSVPICLLLEGQQLTHAWRLSLATGVSAQQLVLNILVSSLSFYSYNEVAFWVLGLVDPITHSICNCLKRVVIIVASSIILRTPHSMLSVAGCALAIGGTFLFARSHSIKEKSSTSASVSVESPPLRS